MYRSIIVYRRNAYFEWKKLEDTRVVYIGIYYVYNEQRTVLKMIMIREYVSTLYT